MMSRDSYRRSAARVHKPASAHAPARAAAAAAFATVAVAAAIAIAMAMAMMTSACNRPSGQTSAVNAERGGEPERQLLQATVAVDVPKVQQLLASGANPNRLAAHEGHDQSPWKLALHQARSNRPETIAIVQQMLKSGANPGVAWGEGPSPRGGYTVQPTTPILEAVSTSTAEVARALMQSGLDPALPETQVALELAVENAETDIVHALVDAGVDVNSHATALTPLVAAIETRNVALMTYLEEHGAREKP